jgi:RNA polymerase sigma-70 factor (ECF subfamily)
MLVERGDDSNELRRADGDAGNDGIADVVLMLRVKRDGDTEAFALLAARYRTPLRRFFAALLPDPAQADDFAQETLLRLWQCRTRYEPTGVFSAYLFQIARHFWLNQRDRCRARAVRELSAETGGADGGTVEIALPPRTQPESVVLERLGRARLRRAVDALPPLYRAVFTLSHDDGLTYAEIAARLGIPVGTVKSRMAEAVRRLRRALEGEE